MARTKYYFLAFDNIDPVNGEKIGEIFRPYVPIRLSLGHGKISNLIDALVDSGADRNLFPYELGLLIGINFKKCPKKYIHGIGGIQIEAYTSKFNIWINGNKYATEADFSTVQQVPLLGRRGFFNLFTCIEFNENERYLEIEHS
jgi:hypothetical protein